MRKTEMRNILPGFRGTMSFTIGYLLLLVVIPLTLLFFKAGGMGWGHFWETVSSPRVVAACRLSLGAAFLAALANSLFGLIVAWVLVRYRFPGSSLLDMLVDLPFALPTAVAGIALTTLYSPEGFLGKFFARFGVQAAFSPLGVVIALTFIGFPFVVRSIQPVLKDLEPEIEEAAACLGASRWKTFTQILFPYLFPAILSGFALAFGRAVGEYGSVVFISGNLPFKTEIAPFLIVSKLEQYDYAGATAIAAILLMMSFVILFAINMIHGRYHAKHVGTS